MPKTLVTFPEILETPQSVLFIAVSRIGDTLFATPAMRAVAETWPHARITALAHPNRAEVLFNNPFLDKTGSIEKRRAILMGRLGGKRYDLAVVYGHDKPLLRYALRIAKRVVAFRQDDPAINSRLYRAVTEAPPHHEHAVVAALRLTNALGIQPSSRRIAYTVTEQERAAAQAFLHASGLGAAKPLIGLQSASFPTKAFRNWPLASFAKLAQQVQSAWPEAGFALLGGPGDKENTTHLKNILGNRAVDLAGQPIRLNSAIMSQLDAYVGVDTGPTHIMSSFDIPLVGLYHCLFPHAIYGPLDHPFDFSLDHPSLGQADCGKDTSMKEISVETVFNRIKKAIAARTA